MNDHDVVLREPAPGGVAVVCACGKRFVRPTASQAAVAHERHWGLESARAAHRDAAKGRWR